MGARLSPGGAPLPGWDVYQAGDGAAIAPTNDLVAHELAGDECVCGPQVVPVTRADGSIGWLYVHNSLDGREAAEK